MGLYSAFLELARGANRTDSMYFPESAYVSTTAIARPPVGVQEPGAPEARFSKISVASAEEDAIVTRGRKLRLR